jgi:hypothetical protein
VRGEGGGARRRHLSPGTRAALARTRFIEVVPAGPSRLHSSAPPRSDEPPVVLHPLWAPVHARRADRTDARGPVVHRTHVLHPGTPPRRGPRPGRRPRPVVPFDIPVEAFAVEVGGGAHPSIRSLGDRRLVYIEHRHAVRRAYRRRQLFFAVGLSGAFVAVAAVALAPSGHAVASEASGTSGRVGAPVSPPTSTTRPVEPPYLRARGGSARRPSGSRGHLVPVGRRRVPADPYEQRFRAAALLVPTDGPLADDPFLLCTQGYESIYAGSYRAVGGGGVYFGAYQFDRVTWNSTARHLKRFDLVGVRPDFASPTDQDLLAYTLYKWQGASHWHYRCAGLP